MTSATIGSRSSSGLNVARSRPERDRLAPHLLGTVVETVHLHLLRAETLHDPDPGNALLDDLGHLGQTLLQPGGHRV